MGLKIYGIKKLQISLKDKAQMTLVKEIVKKHGASLQQEMVKNAVFKKGYSTGATRRSINLLNEKGGLLARVKLLNTLRTLNMVHVLWINNRLLNLLSKRLRKSSLKI